MRAVATNGPAAPLSECPMESSNGAHFPLPLEGLAPALNHPPELVAVKTRAIYEAASSSKNLRAGNFTALADEDLTRLFGLYDASFYGGALAATLRRRGNGMAFRVAPRMTRA